MREILFRGKRMDNGEWVHGYYARHYNDRGNETNRIYIGYSETDCGDFYPDWFEVIPKTVGQYIGLKDMHGTRIFEGDIVTATCLLENRVVEYVDNLCWAAVCVVAADEACEYINEYSEIEVIGNIHDNPELLEV